MAGVGWGWGFGKVWAWNREGGAWESTARVWGREGAVCGHLDPRIGTQHLLPVPTLLSPAVSQPEAAPEPVPRGLISPALGAR